VGKLNSIKANLEDGVYPNEYLFQVDLYQVFALGHDGHFIFYPDAISKAIEFGMGPSLVSISSDGSEIPRIYFKGECCESAIGIRNHLTGHYR
jgi:hypothetical protein